MRKDLGKELKFMPLPVVIIGTYDKEGNPDAMNAAWAGIYDYGKIFISLSEHKTTENLRETGAFTIAFATKETELISDYFGVVSGRKEDKIKNAGVHITKSKYVNAPIIEEYPLVLECEVESFEDGNLIGKVINTSIDEKYIKDDNSIDVDSMELISFDMISSTYRVIGEVVGNAFKDGLNLK